MAFLTKRPRQQLQKNAPATREVGMEMDGDRLGERADTRLRARRRDDD
jgi:hypothetical protein